MITLNPSTLLNGDGIDVNSLVEQMLAQTNGETKILQQRQSDLQSQATLLSQINADLSSLYSAVTTLNDVLGPLSAMTAQSSQSAILTATAQQSATPGTHTIVVSTLATQGTLYTNPVANANTSILPAGVQTADIQFQVGGNGGATHDVAISVGQNDTLSKLVSYINAQNWGVTANVITDSTGARIAIYSKGTGSVAALSVANNTSALVFNAPVGGTDATFTVDGIPFSNSTNTVNGAIPGVTLNLIGAYQGVQVQVAVAPDAAQAAQAIGDFVSAYNAVTNDLNKQFALDPTTNSQGPLASDSGLRILQSRLLSDAAYSPANGAYVNLRSLGITMNDDGTLSVNSSKLTNVLSTDPGSVLQFFQTSTQKGFANNFVADLLILTSPTRGVLNLDLAQNRTEQQNLSNAILDVQDRMTVQQQQLQTQLSQVNAILQAFPYQLRAIQLALGITPSGNSRSGSSGG